MTRYQSAEYVEKFRCDGKACGAQCCRGWAVELSEQDHARLEKEFTGSLVTLGGKRDALARVATENTNRSRPYRISFNAQGACPFLRDDLLCDVHSLGGVAVLPDICAQYPREVAILGGKREMWATLACPEAARLCLFSPTGVAPVELEGPPFLRYANSQLDVTEQTPDYYAYLDEIRQFAVELLERRDWPLRTRLFALAYFGHRVAPYFYNSEATVDRRTLRSDMRAVSTPAFLTGLREELDSNAVPGNYAMALVGSVIPMDFLAEITPVDKPVEGRDWSETVAIGSDTWLQIWMDYCVKRLRWEREFASLIDQAFENYAKVFWLKDWYVTAPNLLVHAIACVLRIAIMRYRLFSSLSLAKISDGAEVDERRTVLEKVLLNVVTDTTRTIDHDRAFRSTLHEALAKRNMEDLAHAGLLLMI